MRSNLSSGILRLYERRGERTDRPRNGGERRVPVRSGRREPRAGLRQHGQPARGARRESGAPDPLRPARLLGPGGGARDRQGRRTPPRRREAPSEGGGGGVTT